MRILSLFLALILMTFTLAAADKATSDDAIYDQVRVKLAGDREVGGRDVEVKVTNGVVELRGTVKREKEKSQAEKLAKKVKGVKSVVNQLRILGS
ncbi:MAG TPA: BON domain-containing protein [Bryobacteraceae bacterium]|nr:BON domain-containing protein [Bryobacteraceae bacterium]